MTQDEIIRMAREAGAFRNYFDYGVEGFAFVDDETLERFAALVAAHEREKQAEQSQLADASLEPVAWAHPSGGYLSARYMKEFATGLEKETHIIPLYAAPVRTKDLTDDEIMKINVDTASIVPTCDRQFHFARAVIAADREKNK